MGVVVWFLERLLWPWFSPDNGLIVQGLALATLVFAGLLVYGLRPNGWARSI